MPPRVTDVGVPVSPFLDRATGDISPAWRAFLLALHVRTGGAIGTDTKALQRELDAEEAARAAADLVLTNGLAQEVIARTDGDNAEAEARREGDAGLQTAVSNEAQARQRADSKLAPRTEVCSIWAACDLSFLPTADPGQGMPWLDGSYMRVGSGAALQDIGLEDATGRWGREDGAGEWLYG